VSLAFHFIVLTSTVYSLKKADASMNDEMVDDFVSNTFLKPSKLETKFDNLYSSENISKESRGSNMN
jgi:hypothetical protein